MPEYWSATVVDQVHCLTVLDRRVAECDEAAAAIHIQAAVQAVLAYVRSYGDRYEAAGIILLAPLGIRIDPPARFPTIGRAGGEQAQGARASAAPGLIDIARLGETPHRIASALADAGLEAASWRDRAGAPADLFWPVPRAYLDGDDRTLFLSERRRDRVLARPNDTVIVELPLSVVARPGAPLAWPDTPPPVRIDLERRPT